MFKPAAGPMRSTRKLQLLSVLSIQGQMIIMADRLWSSLELVGARHFVSCNESVY